MNTIREFLREYTTNRAQARTMNELGGSHGKPWQDTDGVWGRPRWWYIRMMCFERFVRESSAGRVLWSRLKMRGIFVERGGIRFEQEINGVSYTIWGFPPDALEHWPSPLQEYEEKVI